MEMDKQQGFLKPSSPLLFSLHHFSCLLYCVLSSVLLIVFLSSIPTPLQFSLLSTPLSTTYSSPLLLLPILPFLTSHLSNSLSSSLLNPHSSRILTPLPLTFTPHVSPSLLEQRVSSVEARHQREQQDMMELVERQSWLVGQLQAGLGASSHNSSLLQRQQASLTDTVQQLLALVTHCNGETLGWGCVEVVESSCFNFKHADYEHVKSDLLDLNMIKRVQVHKLL